jgi:hypothetical protein
MVKEEKEAQQKTEAKDEDLPVLADEEVEETVKEEAPVEEKPAPAEEEEAKPRKKKKEEEEIVEERIYTIPLQREIGRASCRERV